MSITIRDVGKFLDDYPSPNLKHDQNIKVLQIILDNVSENNLLLLGFSREFVSACLTEEKTKAIEEDPSLRWYKAKMSEDRDSRNYQTDNYFGLRGVEKYAHIAVDPYGDIVFVRDENGDILYDKKNKVGHLPKNLDWN